VIERFVRSDSQIAVDVINVQFAGLINQVGSQKHSCDLVDQAGKLYVHNVLTLAKNRERKCRQLLKLGCSPG
jgi:hypothetical protein